MALEEISPYGWNGPCCAGCEYWTGPRSRGHFDTAVLVERSAEGKCYVGNAGTTNATGGCGNGKIWGALSQDGRSPASGIAPNYSADRVTPGRDPVTGACLTCGGVAEVVPGQLATNTGKDLSMGSAGIALVLYCLSALFTAAGLVYAAGSFVEGYELLWRDTAPFVVAAIMMLALHVGGVNQYWKEL